jgi:transcriptional regulator with XRE-family HTH domain
MLKSRTKRDYRAFLEHLRRARETAGLTQRELAKKLRTTQSFVSKCERGERRLDVVELRLWCEALGTTLSAFVGEVSQKDARP